MSFLILYVYFYSGSCWHFTVDDEKSESVQDDAKESSINLIFYTLGFVAYIISWNL